MKADELYTTDSEEAEEELKRIIEEDIAPYFVDDTKITLIVRLEGDAERWIVMGGDNFEELSDILQEAHLNVDQYLMEMRILDESDGEIPEA